MKIINSILICVLFLFVSQNLYSQSVYAKYKVGKDIFTFYDNGTVYSEQLTGKGSWYDDGNTIMIEIFSTRFQSNWYFMAYETGIGVKEIINIFNPNDMSLDATMILIGNPKEKSEQKVFEREPYAEQYINQGYQYYNENKIKEALESFDNAIKESYYLPPLKRDESYSKCYYGIAIIEYNFNISKAMTAIEQSIEYNSSCAECYNVRAMIICKVYDKINSDYSAKNTYSSILNKYPLPQALEDYNKAIELNSLIASYYANRGIYYWNDKEFDKAVQDITSAIQLDTANMNYYSYRASIYYQLKKYDERMQDLNILLSNDPNNVDNLLRRAKTFYITGNLVSAIQDYDKVVSISVNDTTAYKMLGYVYLEKNDLKKSEKNFSQALSIYKTNQRGNPWDIYLGISMLYFKLYGVADETILESGTDNTVKDYFKSAALFQNSLRDGVGSLNKIEENDYYYFTKKQKELFSKMLKALK